MNEQWILHILVFVFGYFTCRTFYFFGSVKTSVKIIQFAQTIALFIIVRGIEQLQWSRQYRIDIMKENNASERNINVFKLHNDEEIGDYKRKSVQTIIELSGEVYAPITEFDDWDSAMNYVESNKEIVLKFIRRK